MPIDNNSYGEKKKMFRINIKKIICLMMIIIFLISANAAALNNTGSYVQNSSEDIDPLVDLEVTVMIKEIRALDRIDLICNPDFYVKVFIEDVVYSSPIWHNKKYIYKANVLDKSICKWKPSLFMPREASRITLEVTDVRAERIQDISEKDCFAEGIEKIESKDGWNKASITDYELTASFNFKTGKECFKYLWDSINAKRGYSWESNPWVWKILFKMIK